MTLRSPTSVATAVGSALQALGVRHVFGLVGSGNFDLAAASHEAGVEFIAARHEGAVVAMADGYARATGEVGVATVHQGPGFTNTLTSVVEATKSRTPLVLLAADTPHGDDLSNFAVDQEAMAVATGSPTMVLASAESALHDLARAFARARCDRRAVTVLLPLDVQAGHPGSELPSWSSMTPSTTGKPGHPGSAAVSRAADLIVESGRPVIVAGKGAFLADARTDLERLAEGIGGLVGTTALAKGLFRGDPFDLGVIGGFATPATVELVKEADLVLAFGASLNSWTTRHGDLMPPGAPVIQVDDDVASIGVHHPIDMAIVGDARLTAGALLEELEARGHSSPGFRSREVERKIARRWRDEPYEDGSTPDHIDPRTFTIRLDELLPAERTVATDSGHFVAWPGWYLDVPDPHGFIFAQAFQSIGLGLGTAIGALVGRPDRLTVAAVGDGGLLMACGELETIGRLGRPMLVVVYNDAAYGAEVHHFRPSGSTAALVTFPDTDIAAVARAFGCEAATVRSLDDLGIVTEWLTRRDGPLVLDVKVEPSVVVPILEEAFWSEPEPEQAEPE